jgi:hypothetical protein
MCDEGFEGIDPGALTHTIVCSCLYPKVVLQKIAGSPVDGGVATSMGSPAGADSRRGVAKRARPSVPTAGGEPRRAPSRKARLAGVHTASNSVPEGEGVLSDEDVEEDASEPFHPHQVYGPDPPVDSNKLQAWFANGATSASAFPSQSPRLFDPPFAGVSFDDVAPDDLPLEPHPDIDAAAQSSIFASFVNRPDRYTSVPMDRVACSSHIRVVESPLGYSVVASHDLPVGLFLGRYEGLRAVADALGHVSPHTLLENAAMTQNSCTLDLLLQPYSCDLSYSQSKKHAAAVDFVVLGSPECWASYVDDHRGQLQ